MSRTTNESDDSPLSMDQTHSPSIDEGSSGSGSAGGLVLKKGPWTSTEDALLLDYVKKYGEGNWNAVRKRTGLSRCGKSCRLRWANHLRPNLRKGDFTADEERLIIDLHSEMGNKWARMAQHLPGRTDNEIKNFWNTRIKRRIRKGLPLYPPKPSLHTLSEGQCAQNLHKVIGEDARHNGRHQPNSYGIPDVLFDNPVANLGAYHYGSTFPGISASNVVSQGFGPSQSYSYIPLTSFPSKQIRESGTLFPDFSGAVINGMPPFSQFPNGACKKVYHQPFGLADSFPYHLDSSDKNQTPFVGQVTGSHAFQNGNFSASKPPTGALKLELPSLQYPDKDLSTWTTTIHLSSPSLETVDTYIQSSSPTVQMQSDCLSPHNTDLLEAILYQAKTLGSGKNQLLSKNSSSSVATPAVAMDSSGLSLYKREREDYGDPVSPLGHSAASVSSEFTPISSGSLVESLPENALPRSNNKGKTDEHILTPDEVENEISTRVDSSRPDALLDADWFDHEYAKDMGAFLSDDFFSDNKNVNNGTASSQSPGWGLNSCRWNNMPVVCQMSELP